MKLRLRPPRGASAAGRALWLEQAGAPRAAAPERVPARADLCVVGGGMVGLWTAIRAKQADPGLDVIVLESGVCAGGLSGRSGGFVMTAWSKFGSLKKACGVDDALHYARAVERAATDIGAFCEQHAIDADYHQGGWLWAATNTSQLGAWEHTMEALDRVGARPYRTLSPDEVAQLSGSPVHLDGVFEAAPATVHPAKLTRGLMHAARSLGVTVIEGCPVSELDASAGDCWVTTATGRVRASRVVLAISAWATQLPPLKRSLVAIASDVMATAPIDAELDRIGWSLGLSISDSRRLVHYYRPTDDGRVVFGKGGGALAFGDRITRGFDHSPARIAADVDAHFRRTYPMLAGVEIAAHWRGPVDYAFRGLPCIGRLDSCETVLVAAGFCGNGVGPSYVAGGALAELALGHVPSEVPEGLQRPGGPWVPREPVRYGAGRIVRAAVRRKETAEDLERRPGAVVRTVAGLDPTSFVDTA